MTETSVKVRKKNEAPLKRTFSKNEVDAGQWMDHAACKGKTDLMFPKKHKDITYIKEARKLCTSCPVEEACLEYALQFPATDMHGVWARLTPRQLSEEQRRRKIKPTKPTLAALWNDK